MGNPWEKAACHKRPRERHYQGLLTLIALDVVPGKCGSARRVMGSESRKLEGWQVAGMVRMHSYFAGASFPWQVSSCQCSWLAGATDLYYSVNLKSG